MYYQPSELKKLASLALQNNGASLVNAEIVAQALIDAEMDGLPSHGLSRLPVYSAQCACEKVKGKVEPTVERVNNAAISVNAHYGFAFPAINLAIEELIILSQTQGISIATIKHSHHFGVAGQHVEKLARQGLVALMFGNAPKAIAPWGGKEALFGTNPIAFSTPRDNENPLVIDLSLSKVARGKVMLAQQKNEAIPNDWALDKFGKPTTDADEAMLGTMLPMGDIKGASLVLMVEILSAALTGSHFGFEASSLFDAKGEPPNLGQVLIAIDPKALGGDHYVQRIEYLLMMITNQHNTRLPGDRRIESRLQTTKIGIKLTKDLYQEIQKLSKSK